MNCFNTISTATANSDLDLTKHVNYTSGMILGVDDFTQEFAYLAGRDRWLARDALGFGTVSGLQVVVDKEDGKRPRVMVLPGVALSPRGQLICVSTAQCAYLNEWLAANVEELKKSAPVTSPPTEPLPPEEATLYVVLCYRDCAVDKVPIPGEPCRSEEELMAASRIQDDFSLELRFEAPVQPEEERTREFARWLKEIKIVDSGNSTALEDFKKFVRAKWLPATSPPTETSPPASAPQVNTKDTLEYMRAAFRLWATELRAALTGRKTGCAVEMTGGAEIEDCVLLAELKVPLESVTTGLKVSDTKDVTIGEDRRPFLLHLRMLQEWMLGDVLSAPGTASAPSPAPVSLDSLEDVEAPSPQAGHVLIFDGSRWVNKEPEAGGGGGVTDHGNLVGLGDDDHPQYLPVGGNRAMTGALDAGGFNIKNVKIAQNNGEAVPFEQFGQAVKKEDAAQGDLSGKYSAPIVAALQGNKVTPGVPPANSVLMFKGGAWTPSALPEPQPAPPQPLPAQKTEVILPLATISRVRDLVYEIWFNVDAPGNLVRVVDFKENQLQIHDETDTAPTFLTNRFTFKFEPGVRNVFVCTLAMPGVTIPGIPTIPIPGIPGIPGFPRPNVPGSTIVEQEPDRMRFRFDISTITVEVTKPGTSTAERMVLSEFAEKNNIKFTGSLDGKVVTIFVRGFNR